MVTKTSDLSDFFLHMSFSSPAQDILTKKMHSKGIPEKPILGAGAPNEM